MRILMGLILTGLCIVTLPTVEANEGGGEKGAETAGPQYLPLESLIVNLEGRRHYLRVDIQLLVDNAEHVEKIKEHMPAIRDGLIMLFSGRNPEQISEVPEREKLRQSAKEEIIKILEHHHIDKGVEDVFFTDFLVQ